MSRIDETGRSSMVRTAQGGLLFESIVFFEDEELVFGRVAKQAAAAQPNRAAEYVARDLGQRAYSRAIGGELLPVELIEACLLEKLHGEASAQGAAKPAVVLAVAACFDQAQRKALLDAALIADVDVLGTINGTLAAALSFAETQGYLHPGTGEKSGCRVLVFDLGGGKLDVAIVEVKPGSVRMLGVAGDARLGGRDWDLRLADHLADLFSKQFGDDPRYDMVSVRRLVESSQEAKHTLTARQQARVHVERHGQAADITITRQAFEQITADLVERARRVTELTLSQAAMAWPDMAHVLLVGGATRMPMIVKMLDTLTGLKPAPNVDPDEAVARGAALAAERLLAAREKRASKVQFEVVELTAHNLGIEWADPQTGRTENVVIIPRGTQLPCGTDAKMTTTADEQRSLSVQLLEGESRNAQACSRIAELVIAGLPTGLPKNSPIEVQYQYTAEGRLQVKAHLQDTGQALTIEVRRDRGLSPAQVADWKKLRQQHLGLKAILAKLGSQQSEASGAPPTGIAGRQTPARPRPPLGRSVEEFSFEDAEEALGARLRKRKITPRQRALMVAGYVVSSVLGLAIGYYILMRVEPSYNWYHLPLPGLSREAPASGALSTEKR
jgi:molecular chaperone DnaK